MLRFSIRLAFPAWKHSVLTHPLASRNGSHIHFEKLPTCSASIILVFTDLFNAESSEHVAHFAANSSCHDRNCCDC